jgi:RNA polymerase sigma factor (sigma-70 family)
MDNSVNIPVNMPEQQEKVTIAVRNYGKKLFDFIRRRVATDEDAEDILQDVYYQYVSHNLVEPIEQASAWLFRVAGNKVIDWYRKKKPVSLEGDDEADAAAMPEYLLADFASIPDDLMNRSLFWEVLQQALDELPEMQRQVFVMHELEDLSFKQIEEMTGENQNTLLSRKRYAVLHLRSRLQDFYNEFLNK